MTVREEPHWQGASITKIGFTVLCLLKGPKDPILSQGTKIDARLLLYDIWFSLAISLLSANFIRQIKVY